MHSGVSDFALNGLSDGGLVIAHGRFVATFFATNDSILGGELSEINRDK